MANEFQTTRQQLMAIHEEIHGGTISVLHSDMDIIANILEILVALVNDLDGHTHTIS